MAPCFFMKNTLYKELLIFVCHNVHELIYVGYRMHPDELLQALENSGIEVLDNNETIDNLSRGYECCSLLGDMNSGIIANQFTQEMPNPSDNTVEALSMDSTLPDFSPPTNETPGLG